MLCHDELGKHKCSTLQDLYIGGGPFICPGGARSEIRSLASLHSIGHVLGSLAIRRLMLTSLEGLDNLQAVGGLLTISENKELK